MSRVDSIAVLLSLAAVVAAALVGELVFERVPHLEDEIAYVWQARVMATDRVVIESPVEPKKFLVPFVVDFGGQRFGKYPLGWPALLSLGIRLGARWLVNPLLAGLAVWLTYRLGKKLMGEVVGLLAAVLTLTSPFFLLNSGSLLSHPFGLVLSTAFALLWWDVTRPQGFARPQGFSKPLGSYQHWLPPVTAGLVLGTFALVRPFSALGVAIPFGLHGLYLLVRGPRAVRKRVLAVGAIAALVGGVHILWQAAATGNPWLNLYTLWWPYDRIGFGPGVGVTRSGHNLRYAWTNLRFSMQVGLSDLFGWARYSWIFLPFGLWAARKNGPALLTGSVFFVLVGWHTLYWIGAWLFGPRYQFEGLFSLTILSAVGISWLAGWQLAPGDPKTAGARSGQTGSGKWQRRRPLAVTGVVAFLILVNLIFYLPPRMQSMQNLYTISRAQQAPFRTETALELTPAVVIVHATVWMQYGGLLELEDPDLTTPFVFAFGPKSTLEATIREHFPDRAIYHYYPDEPDRLYSRPRGQP